MNKVFLTMFSDLLKLYRLSSVLLGALDQQARDRAGTCKYLITSLLPVPNKKKQDAAANQQDFGATLGRAQCCGSGTCVSSYLISTFTVSLVPA